MKKLLLILFFISISGSSATAYLDPGTGSVMVSSLWPLTIAFLSAILAFLVKYFWKPIKGTIFRTKKEPKKVSEQFEKETQINQDKQDQ